MLVRLKLAFTASRSPTSTFPMEMRSHRRCRLYWTLSVGIRWPTPASIWKIGIATQQHDADAVIDASLFRIPENRWLALSNSFKTVPNRSCYCDAIDEQMHANRRRIQMGNEEQHSILNWKFNQFHFSLQFRNNSTINEELKWKQSWTLASAMRQRNFQKFRALFVRLIGLHVQYIQSVQSTLYLWYQMVTKRMQ